MNMSDTHNDDNTSQSGAVVSGDIVSSAQFTELEVLHSGVFNVIAKAKRYGRWWAIKSLKEEMRGDEAYEALLRKEFDILISMQHPNVVSAVGFEYVAPLGNSIVMEWVEGQSLKAWLGEKHTRRERLHIVSQILSALNYIHTKQVVVRDLKPSNVMITYNGRHVKLIDFGLSDADSYTIFKQPAGSPGYMSPEQGRSRVADLRNDIYSLGCILDDFKLGWTYNAVVRRCKASATHRYANTEELSRALGRVAMLRRIVLPFLILAFLMGGVMLSVNRLSTGQQTIEVLEGRLDSAQRELQTLAGDKQMADNIITEGKQKMDSIARYDLSKLTTYDECVNTYTRLALELTHFHQEYCGAYDSKVSYEDNVVIRQALSDYFTQVLKPLEHKITTLFNDKE